MAISSKPTEHHWNSSQYSTILLSCDALSSSRDGFGSLIPNMTSTAETGTEFYDRSLTSRRYALVGMVCSGVFSCCCIIAGISIMVTDKEDGATAAIGVLSSSKLQKDMIFLVLNLIVTICTESTGFVRGI